MKFQNGFADGPSPILKQSTLFCDIWPRQGTNNSKKSGFKTRGVSGSLRNTRCTRGGCTRREFLLPPAATSRIRSLSDTDRLPTSRIRSLGSRHRSHQHAACSMQSSCLPILRQAARKPWRPRHWPTALQNSKRNEASVRTAGGDQPPV